MVGGSAARTNTGGGAPAGKATPSTSSSTGKSKIAKKPEMKHEFAGVSDGDTDDMADF